MRNIKGYFFTLSLLCFIGIVPALVQTAAQTTATAPAPTPVVVDDNEVVKIDTNLIQVDAIVTDRNGKVISDLKPEDFELTENGKKRQLVGFSFVNTDTRAASFSNELILSSSNSTLSDTPARTVGQIGRIYAIVVDDLRLSGTGMDIAKKELVKFVGAEVQPGDLVAVIKTSGSVGILQKFTNDKEEILTSIGSLKAMMGTGVGVESFPALSGISFSQQVLSAYQGAGLSEAQLSRVSGGGAESIGEGIRDSVNGLGGLQVLIKVIEAMGYMRGKKSILYVSNGFSPLSVTNKMYSDADKSVINSTNGNSYSLVDDDSITVAGRSYVVNNFLRVITEAANRNSVSIFPVDPGVATTNVRANDDTGGGDAMNIAGTTSKLGDQTFNNSSDSRNTQIRLRQDTLKYLARETGGKAFVNSNQVATDLKESLDIQKGYYLLAYEPDADTFNPKDSRYNKFDIKVRRSGAEVSFRTGFFNTVIDNKSKAATESQTILQKMMTPYNFADVGVELSSIFAGITGNKATIRSFVNVMPKDLTVIDGPAGKKMVKFDVYVAVFNEQGLAAGSAAQNFTVSFDPKVSDGFIKSGLVSTMGFEVSQTGVYRVKVLVKDSGSNRIGTISQNIYVPDFNKKNLAFSGLLLQTFSPAEWADLQKNPSAAGNGQKMQVDTAFRHYKTGQVLTYTYALNMSPKSGDTKVSLSTKLIRDGQTVFSGNPEDLPVAAGQKLNRRNAVNLGTDMKPGKYTLQITATGDNTKTSETESIDFEIVN